MGAQSVLSMANQNVTIVNKKVCYHQMIPQNLLFNSSAAFFLNIDQAVWSATWSARSKVSSFNYYVKT